MTVLDKLKETLVGIVIRFGSEPISSWLVVKSPSRRRIVSSGSYYFYLLYKNDLL